MSGSTEAISTLRLRQKVTWGKLAATHRHLNVTGDLGLIDLDRFNYTKNIEESTAILDFYKGDKWFL